MKKLLSFLSLVTVSATMMFANVEINPRIYGDFISFNREYSFSIGSTNLASISYDANIIQCGAELETNFWFAHPWIMDIGLSTSLDIGFGPATYKTTVKLLRTSISSDLSDFVFSSSFCIAPAFQFNAGRKHSIFFAPGLQLNALSYKKIQYTTYGADKDKHGVFDLLSTFAIDFGYKYWFGNKAGLNLGYQLELPLKSLSTYKFDSGIGNRFYAGLCFNLGKRYFNSKREE